MTQYKRFEPPKRLLLGPGPSPVDDRILAAMAAPVLDALYRALNRDGFACASGIEVAEAVYS
jgi:aspartate aminotransferase-like enzyme